MVETVFATSKRAVLVLQFSSTKDKGFQWAQQQVMLLFVLKVSELSLGEGASG